MSGPRLVTWSERQLAEAIADLLYGLNNVLMVPDDADLRRQIAGVVAAGLTHPKIEAVRIVSPLDNPALVDEIAQAMWASDGDKALAFWSLMSNTERGRWRDMARVALRVVFGT